jgi:pimeloyl-ACP methyl ester carboxylesterase
MPSFGSMAKSRSRVFRLGCSVPAPEQRRRWSRSKNFLGALVVSRGGRPDLAGDALDSVYAPTLLIVGGADFDVIELNEQALARLPGTKALEIVPGASHLFPEAGALEAVIEHAAIWFERHLGLASNSRMRVAKPDKSQRSCHVIQESH